MPQRRAASPPQVANLSHTTPANPLLRAPGTEWGAGPGGLRGSGVTLEAMTQPTAPKIQLVNTAEYRENYANSVQVRVNLWDFFLMFGRVNQTAPDSVAIHNFQGIYVSPQQAKALLNVLSQNVTQYESAFGEIRLEPQAGTGIVQ